ncbi:hypothetical protein BET01_18775 [Lacrimispora algidixylanolytica]|uniref:Transcriptional regulator n=2 Tax=Lacrimispora algidixylanolytica TaxID=94868 RepID=A0A419T3F4_9FIRM|nr:hypothetical protein BET01_18775 [Lacrimispora algidixylanolytica]
MKEFEERKSLWEATQDELIKGFYEDCNCVYCLICKETYIKGEIYLYENHFYDAYKMIEIHSKDKHGSMLDYLLSLNCKFLGISSAQQFILKLMADGKSDKEISEEKGISCSTVRNHRYKMHEYEKQAKLFLGTMELFKNKEKSMKLEDSTIKFYDAHKTATMIDDRYNVTVEEKKKIIEKYLDQDGIIKQMPAKEKAKIIILREIANNFTPGIHYKEIEINNTLKKIHTDFPYIRRLLIEYGFLDRTDSCSEYWIKE